MLLIGPYIATVLYALESVVPPPGWIQRGRAPHDHVIDLHIGLYQQNFHLLELSLEEASNPDHERYGKHLSKNEVERLVAPHPLSASLVNDWLSSHGIDKKEVTRSPSGDWIKISLPVVQIEQMIGTEFHVWEHASSRDTVVRTTRYYLPPWLHTHIETIQPTTVFSRWNGMRSKLASYGKPYSLYRDGVSVTNSSGIHTDSEMITVSQLKKIYNATAYIPSATNNSIGITAYLEQYANIDDLRSFYTDQVPEAVPNSSGENNQSKSEAGGEANLDVQFAFGLSYPTPGTLWSTAGRPPFNTSADSQTNTNEPYLDWLRYVLYQEDGDIPLVISTSYGDEEQTVPQSYATRVCKEFAQLGARGISLLFSSGDGGVGDGDPYSSSDCISNDGKNTKMFLPSFPASVTAVGGTTGVPEVAVDFSGGGFSNYFARPSYQTEAVSQYLSNLPQGTYDGLFNSTGRAYPDISAQADYYRVWYQGCPQYFGGTSASAPAVAGFIALLNDARLSKGLSSLGFLNPWLYKNAFHVLNDITSGNNPGCGTQGFNAAIGWDPVTGLGTPNFGKLLEIVT
ncbi:subtilisin-like protein [Fistulina hepatica ATCC 64428]|uniref:tripeptidyl-peptidase II n=1 Tax=Fistulina hepatica ATCC 64428 TaxID=1128425 RepID=A0A0D7AKQ1_9AGAR|nr:subtilisin-like protein [Fistulina hepatica ATCC 64428]